MLIGHTWDFSICGELAHASRCLVYVHEPQVQECHVQEFERLLDFTLGQQRRCSERYWLYVRSLYKKYSNWVRFSVALRTSHYSPVAVICPFRTRHMPSYRVHRRMMHPKCRPHTRPPSCRARSRAGACQGTRRSL